MNTSEHEADLGGPVHYLEFHASAQTGTSPAGINGQASARGPAKGQGLPPTATPPIVLVHGLGGSVVNWLSVGSLLATRTRVFALDLVGFGRTPMAGRSATLPSNMALVSRFIREVAGCPAIVMGNSMGGAISVLLSAEQPELVSRLVLVNSALPRPFRAPVDPLVAAVFSAYMIPGVGELVLRLRMSMGPERFVRDTLRLCGVDRKQMDQSVYRALVEVATARRGMPWANGAFLAAARSLMRTLAARDRFHQRLMQVRAPTLMIQGSADRLVPVAAAQAAARMRPDFALSILDGVGHTPMLEVPERFVETVLGWMDRGG